MAVNTTLIVVLVVVVLIAFMLIGVYNRLVALNQNANQAFADIDVQLKQRRDLIPNLVETVKGYAAHESGTLEAVVAARNAAASARTVDDKVGAENMLTASLGRLFALSEAYPDLKANQNFLALQSQLEGTENRIAVARRDFILAVQKYNTEIRTFPGRLWHSVMYSDLPIRETFEATSPGADKAPEVKF